MFRLRRQSEDLTVLSFHTFEKWQVCRSVSIGSSPPIRICNARQRLEASLHTSREPRMNGIFRNMNGLPAYCRRPRCQWRRRSCPGPFATALAAPARVSHLRSPTPLRSADGHLNARSAHFEGRQSTAIFRWRCRWGSVKINVGDVQTKKTPRRRSRVGGS